jgi:hypothetical protein
MASDTFEAKFGGISLGQVQAGSITFGNTSQVIEQPSPKVKGERVIPMGGGGLRISFKTRQTKANWKLMLDYLVALPGTMSRNLATLQFIVNPGGTKSITNCAYMSFSAPWQGPTGNVTIDWSFVVSDQARAAV